MNRPFDINLIGRYAITQDVTLSSLTPYRSDDVSAEQAKPLQIVGRPQSDPGSGFVPHLPETLILDGTGGPLDLPFSFVRPSTLGGSRIQVEGSGIAIDLANRDYLENVPVIDLRGAGQNRLTLDAPAVQRAGQNRLVVLADSDDDVRILDEAFWTILSESATDIDFPNVAFTQYYRDVYEDLLQPVSLWISNSIDAATHPAGPPSQSHAASTLTRSLGDLPATQIVEASTNSSTIGPGQTFTVDVAYHIDGAAAGRVPPGMLVEVHYDSDLVKFNRVKDVTGAADFVPSILANSAEPAELISDGDLKTDGVIILSWSEILGMAGQNDWPSDAGTSTRLITLEFTSEQFVDAGNTNIKLTGESAAGFQLELKPLKLAL
ncbi:MAG: hypothetical protein KDA47_22885, partial [Planctomycetales bacterium]|nr:hypothetical protein [Planctomycetales bacterium]